jgi:hypothetical protein
MTLDTDILLGADLVSMEIRIIIIIGKIIFLIHLTANCNSHAGGEILAILRQHGVIPICGIAPGTGIQDAGSYQGLHFFSGIKLAETDGTEIFMQKSHLLF